MAGPWEKYGGASAPAPAGDMIVKRAPVEKPDKPNLPQGYRIGPDGKTAERIPGLPPEKGDDGVGRAMTTNKSLDMQDDLTALKQFEVDLNSVEKQYTEHFANQGLGTVREILPDWMNTTNENYNETSRRMLPMVAKALGFSSKQMDTPAELKRLEAYIPRSTDGDETARNKIKVLRGMLNRQRAAREQQLGGSGQSAPKRFRYNPATGELE